MKTKSYLSVLAILFASVLSCEKISKRSLTGEYNGTKRHYSLIYGSLVDTTELFSFEVTKRKDRISVLHHSIPYDALKDDGFHYFTSIYSGQPCWVSFKDDSLICKFYIQDIWFWEEFVEYKMVKK